MQTSHWKDNSGDLTQYVLKNWLHRLTVSVSYVCVLLNMCFIITFCAITFSFMFLKVILKLSFTYLAFYPSQTHLVSKRHPLLSAKPANIRRILIEDVDPRSHSGQNKVRYKCFSTQICSVSVLPLTLCGFIMFSHWYSRPPLRC